MALAKVYNGDEPYIFISYSHRDADIVLKIVGQMQADGYRAWYDEGINPGTEWDDYIAAKINESCYFIAFLSENYLGSSNCKDEMNYSRDHVENILLVYLEDVSLPSGMEMRFGRYQAILAYNYKDQSKFFDKLYLSKGLVKCKETSTASITEESLESFLSKTNESTTDAKPKEAAPVKAVQADKIEIPAIKVDRVPARKAKSNNQTIMWIIVAAAAVLVIALVVVGIIVTSNKNSKNKTTESDNESETIQTSTEDTDYYPTDEPEETVPDTYSGYGLSIGENYYAAVDSDFFLYTGIPQCYDAEKDDYIWGVFTDSSSMLIMIPVYSDFSSSIHVQWYYEEPDGTETLVADQTNIYPIVDEGLNWYEYSLSSEDLGGNIPVGDYYAVVFVGDDTEPSVITKIEYRTSK